MSSARSSMMARIVALAHVEGPAAACSGRPFGALADGRGKKKAPLGVLPPRRFFRLFLIIKVLFLYPFMLRKARQDVFITRRPRT